MSWAIAALMFAISGLYAAVGQAGATGYLAAMGLVGLPPSVMRPTALLLNVLVALVATVRFKAFERLRQHDGDSVAAKRRQN